MRINKFPAAQITHFTASWNSDDRLLEISRMRVCFQNNIGDVDAHAASRVYVVEMLIRIL